METKTFEQEQKTITIHQYEPNEDLFPFAIVEETTTNEEREVTTFTPTLGNQKVCEETFNNLISCEEFITSKPYSLILALICHVIEMKKQYEKEQLKLQNHETK